ncbi:MAG: oligopeptide ABC transporter substrate-binding protein, partial [Vitreimonas sp.]
MTHFDLRRRHALIGALAAGALAADAARGQDQDKSAKTARRRLTIGMSGFPPGLEPVLFNHTATRRVVPQMFDTLIAFDHAKNMVLRPALAERWERLGPRALRLSLRKG